MQLSVSRAPLWWCMRAVHRGGAVLDGLHTRKAKLARPSVRPGRGWYRVPAFATKASVVVGPAKSLLANLTPLASPDWYWKDPEAGAASPRFCDCETWRAARCAPRQAVVRDSIVERAPIGGRWSWGWRAIDGELMDRQCCKDVAKRQGRHPPSAGPGWPAPSCQSPPPRDLEILPSPEHTPSLLSSSNPPNVSPVAPLRPRYLANI